jgi:hypothetical protein
MVAAVYEFILDWWWAVLICLYTGFDFYVSADAKRQIAKLIDYYDQYDDLSVELILKKIVACDEVIKRKSLKCIHFWLAVSTFLLAGILVALLKGNS